VDILLYTTRKYPVLSPPCGMVTIGGNERLHISYMVLSPPCGMVTLHTKNISDFFSDGSKPTVWDGDFRRG